MTAAACMRQLKRRPVVVLIAELLFVVLMHAPNYDDLVLVRDRVFDKANSGMKKRVCDTSNGITQCRNVEDLARCALAFAQGQQCGSFVLRVVCMCMCMCMCSTMQRSFALVGLLWLLR